MNRAAAFDWAERSLRLDSKDPYLRIQFVPVFVRDLERSIQFFVEQLGFSVIMDARPTNRDRRVAVAPPDGTALLSLRAAGPGSQEYQQVGHCGPIVFFTDDVKSKFEEWSAGGVRFRSGIQVVNGEGPLYAEFEDLDGNSFTLAGVDGLTRALEERRRALAYKEEAERRAAQELEIAKQVQSRLFPQIRPALRNLEYAGLCEQARDVGGDYYDFLDLGQERLGLVIGDISGKGIAAALLMANLQANLRSQSALALQEPLRMLRSVNQLFYDNTDDNAYATLFFAEFDDHTGHLRYANCGHLPALLLRANGDMETLEATGTVLGLFKEWDGVVSERTLFPGDLLMLYTDGVTESSNAFGEEFGAPRLLSFLGRNRCLSPRALLGKVLDEIREFSGSEQQDDITLIIAKL